MSINRLENRLRSMVFRRQFTDKVKEVKPVCRSLPPVLADLTRKKKKKADRRCQQGCSCSQDEQQLLPYPGSRPRSRQLYELGHGQGQCTGCQALEYHQGLEHSFVKLFVFCC